MPRPKRRYPRCAKCRKVAYPGQARALAAAVTLAKGGKTWRVYRGQGCDGWHVTSIKIPGL